MPMPTTNLTVSVIMPVRRGDEAFRLCLRAVTAAQPAPDEVIVVLDGADEEAGSFAQSLSACLARTLVQSGPAAARNLGARVATGEILFFVDADVLVPANAVGLVLAAFRGTQPDPEVAAVFGSYDDLPAAPNFLSQYKNLLHHYVHQHGREDASTFWAGCGAIRRDVFLSLGGFDERYGQPCIEDIELGYRLRAEGHRIRLIKSLRAKHLKRWSVRSLLQSDLFARALPWSDLILRTGFVDDLNVDLRGRISVGLACALPLLLLAALRFLVLFWIALAVGLALLGLNASLYRFFWQKRGLWFALGAVAWHWFYFLYSGVAFAVAVLRHVLCILQLGRANRDLQP
jgi:GT2 family glycosyltransferase